MQCKVWGEGRRRKGWVPLRTSMITHHWDQWACFGEGIDTFPGIPSNWRRKSLSGYQLKSRYLIPTYGGLGQRKCEDFTTKTYIGFEKVNFISHLYSVIVSLLSSPFPPLLPNSSPCISHIAIMMIFLKHKSNYVTALCKNHKLRIQVAERGL